jgi:hypothetical protein
VSSATFVRYSIYHIVHSIAGYLRTLVLDNRTAYHGHFELLRLETGFEQLSGGVHCLRGGFTDEKKWFDFYKVDSH